MGNIEQYSSYEEFKKGLNNFHYNLEAGWSILRALFLRKFPEEELQKVINLRNKGLGHTEKFVRPAYELYQRFAGSQEEKLLFIYTFSQEHEKELKSQRLLILRDEIKVALDEVVFPKNIYNGRAKEITTGETEVMIQKIPILERYIDRIDEMKIEVRQLFKMYNS